MTQILTEAQINAFVAGCQDIIQKYHTKAGYSFTPDTLEYSVGPRFVKIIRVGPGHRSVHCFLRRSDGAVMKAASWLAPAKHARGNVNDPDRGLGCMGPYGAAYLR